MRQFYHILKYKFIANSRISFSGKFSEILKELGSFFVYTGFAFGAFLVSETSLSILLERLRIGHFLLHEFISIIFFIFFMSINVGNIIVSWSTLYKSDEISYYFTKPIPSFKLFLIKFIDNIFYSSSTLLLVLLAIFLGYVFYFQLSFTNLLIILIFDLIPFIVSAASLGVIVLLTIVKLASVFGVRKLIAVVSLIYLGSLFIFFNSLSPMSLVYSVLANYPNVDQYFGDLIPSIAHYMPNQWFSDSLYWMLKNDIAKLSESIIKQISLAVFLFGTATFLGHKWYYRTWLKNIKLTIRNKSGKHRVSLFVEKLFSRSSNITSIIIKDLLMFFRDSTQIIHSIILIILIIVFMVSSSGISYLSFEDIQMAGTIYLSINMFIILLLTTLALRFIFPIISLEGKVFWKIRTSPVTYLSLINIKIIPYTVVLVLIAGMLAFFSHLKLAPHLTFYALPTVISSAFFISMLNFCMGIVFVRYNEKNAIRIASSKGASLTFLLSIVYMLIIVLILFPAVQEHFIIVLSSNYYIYSRLIKSYYITTVFSIFGGLTLYLISLRIIRTDY